MGILTRFKDIMSANINALLDKCEDPEKMIDQYMRNLESDLGKVKAETASVMAEETRAKRELDECTEQVNKMQSYAEKALTAGNEADARKFLEKKQQLVSTQTALQQSYEAAAANAAKMRQMHDKLVKDIESLESRKAAIKAKVATAKAQERLNSIGSSVTGANNSMAAFSKMEAKANKMLDEANAMAELNQSQEDSDIDNLAAKYDSAPQDAAVDDELHVLERFERMVKDVKELELCGLFESGEQLLDYLKEQPLDAVFLDIEMPDVNGLQLSEQVLDLNENNLVIGGISDN